MLAEKLLVSKENEIETLKSQIAIYKKYSEMLEAKNQAQKNKIASHKEVISSLRVECETKSAELADLKAQLASKKETISNKNKVVVPSDSDNEDM